MESESCIWLSPEDRARLEGWVAGRKTPQKLVWRARIVLMWSQRAGIADCAAPPAEPEPALVAASCFAIRVAIRLHVAMGQPKAARQLLAT